MLNSKMDLDYQLFAGNPKGATENAIVYSLVETAKANGLNPYKYLKLLVTAQPKYHFKKMLNHQKIYYLGFKGSENLHNYIIIKIMWQPKWYLFLYKNMIINR